jgi:hypothetical protein
MRCQHPESHVLARLTGDNCCLTRDGIPAAASGILSDMRTLRLPVVSLALLVLLLAACASVPLRNPPRLDVVGVQIERVEGPDAFYTVTVAVTNDRDDEVVIDALQAQLAIEGETVAQATLASPPLRVPAHGSVRADLAAHSGMDAVLRAAANAMRRGIATLGPGMRPSLRYSVEGTATLGGVRLPFARSGDIGERAP